MFESLEREETLIGRKMAALRKKAAIPAPLLDLVEKVMAAQSKARAKTVPAGLPDGAVASVDKVIQGAHLLAREDFPIEIGPALALFDELSAILTGMGGPMAQAAAVVAQEGESLKRAAFTAFLKNDVEFFEAFARRTPSAPRTLDFLAQSSLTPQIMALADYISAALPKERNFEQATCPVCGSLAFHSVLEGKEGVRVNCCSFCRASFRTYRMQCPYCQERDAAKLPFFNADEEPGYRVDVCLSCNGYIKTTDFRDLDRASFPPLNDLESMTLDLLAVKRGYKRPTVSAWGF